MIKKLRDPVREHYDCDRGRFAVMIKAILFAVAFRSRRITVLEQ